MSIVGLEIFQFLIPFIISIFLLSKAPWNYLLKKIYINKKAPLFATDLVLTGLFGIAFHAALASPQKNIQFAGL